MLFTMAHILTDWMEKLPIPVFKEDESLIPFYYQTWQYAHDHIKEAIGAPQTPYMDEACYEDQIWIWDTCFMSLYTRYAPDVFPGIQSLNNFYKVLYDGWSTPLGIWFMDNPPLFAWAEYHNHLFINDTAHIKQLLLKDKYLEKHFNNIETMKPGTKPPYVSNEVYLQKFEDKGYIWDGQHCGMDNCERNRDGQQLFIDAISQQALSALYQSQLFSQIKNHEQAAKWNQTYQKLKKTINDLYWDETVGLYVDIDKDTLKKSDMYTIASFWPLLAEVASHKQAKRMAEAIKNDSLFGGPVPLVSLARSDKDFDNTTGEYWRGAVWLPTAYMVIKGLENYGLHDLADECSYKILQWMNTAYKSYKPATVWECYNPNKPEPSTEYGKIARGDFCGWSALGPISLFIENVIGVKKVTAYNSTVELDFKRTGEYGVKQLRFGVVNTDIIHQEDNNIYVKSNSPFVIVSNGKKYQVKVGEQVIVPE